MSRSILASFLFVAAALGFAAHASAQISIGIGNGGIGIDIGGGRPYPPGPGPRPIVGPVQPVRPSIEYVVTEHNPITRGVHSSRTFADRRAADAYRLGLARAHWVQWRYWGINEPLRARRFDSAGQAQYFIDTDGPSRAAPLGIALLDKDTRLVASRVTLTERRR